MNKEEVLKLAKLARIEVSEAEAENLTHEFEAILGYVGEIRSLVGSFKSEEKKKEDYPIRNVFREDANPHEGGLYTEEMLSSAPSRDGKYIKVKKIL
jgi:aspartyl-tRNA(Asn)/glutamyl-tRNA(Gln) amidotransferase subunit C